MIIAQWGLLCLIPRAVSVLWMRPVNWSLLAPPKRTALTTTCTAASGSGNWSCQESEAPRGKVCKPPTAFEEELLNILTEAVKDLGLDWSPSQQRVKNKMDMWFLQSGHRVVAPRDLLRSSQRSTMRSRSLGTPSIWPEPKQWDLFCFPLSMVPTTWDTPNLCPSKRPLQPTSAQLHMDEKLRHCFPRSRAVLPPISLTKHILQPARQHRPFPQRQCSKFFKPTCCRSWMNRVRILSPSGSCAQPQTWRSG